MKYIVYMTMSQSIKHWISAMRLRTLPLAISAILLGTSIAGAQASVDVVVLGLTVGTAILLQILSNLANDYGDSIHGADSAARVGPSRAVQAGHISREAMRKAIVWCSVLAVGLGLCLLIVGLPQMRDRLVFLGLGLASVFAAVLYTNGRLPYGYVGLGDVFVWLFFGLVAVGGTYYLQVQSLDASIWMPASAMGLLSVGVLNVNNIRDIESDRLAGKNSIPVRLGRIGALVYHTSLVTAALGLSQAYVWISSADIWNVVGLLWLHIFGLHIGRMWTGSSSDLDLELKRLALITLGYVLTLCALLWW